VSQELRTGGAPSLRERVEKEIAILRGRDTFCADLLNCPVPAHLYRLKAGSDLQPGSGLESVLRSGWCSLENWGVWSNGCRALIRVSFQQETTFPVSIEMDLIVFKPVNQSSSLAIALGSHKATALRFESFPNMDTSRSLSSFHSFPVMAEDLSTELWTDIVFHIERPVSPAELGLSEDRRKLGVGIKRLKVL
jgi:hypothetical protein